MTSSCRRAPCSRPTFAAPRGRRTRCAPICVWRGSLIAGRRLHAVFAADCGRRRERCSTRRSLRLLREELAAGSESTLTVVPLLQTLDPGAAGCCPRHGGSGTGRRKRRRRTRSRPVPAPSAVPHGVAAGERLVRINALPSPRREPAAAARRRTARARSGLHRLFGRATAELVSRAARLHDRPTRVPWSRSRRAVPDARIDGSPPLPTPPGCHASVTSSDTVWRRRIRRVCPSRTITAGGNGTPL